MVCAAKVFVRGTGTKWGIGKGSEICIKIKIYISLVECKTCLVRYKIKREL